MKRSARLLAAIGLLIAILAGCLLAACSGTDDGGGSMIVVGLAAEPDSMNIYLARTAQSLLIADRILPRLAHEVLPDEHHDAGLVPDLARSWEFDETRRELTFHLAPSRRWSDGSEVVCEDVAFTYEAQTSAEIKWRGSAIKKRILRVECPDPHTAVFVFEEPYPGQVMDANDLHILSRGLREIPFSEWRQVDWSEAMIAGGAYEIAAVTPGQEILLEANDGWGGEPDPPLIDRVSLRIVPDASSRVTQLLSGDLDLVDNLSPDEARRLQSEDGVDVIRRPSFRYTYMGYNALDPAAYREYRRHREADCRDQGDENCFDEANVIADIARSHPHPLFGDARVRRALTLAIDRSALIDSLLLGEGEVPASPFLAPLPEHDPELEPWPFDQERARVLLAHAGFGDRDGDTVLDRDGTPFSFTLAVQSGHALRMQAASLIEQQLREIGIEVELLAIESSSFYSRIGGHDVDAWIGGWRASLRVDATENLHASACGTGGANFGCWTERNADELAARTRLLDDREERIAGWRAWERLFHQEQPYTLLLRPYLLTGVSRSLAGPETELHPGDTLARVERWTIEPEGR